MRALSDVSRITEAKAKERTLYGLALLVKGHRKYESSSSSSSSFSVSPQFPIPGISRKDRRRSNSPMFACRLRLESLRGFVTAERCPSSTLVEREREREQRLNLRALTYGRGRTDVRTYGRTGHLGGWALGGRRAGWRLASGAQSAPES